MARIQTYAEFWEFYLVEHSNPTNRRLHYAGTSLGLAVLATAIIMRTWWLILVGITCGYAFAWVGHFFFQKNKPATFQYPLWSLISDFRMWWWWISRKT